MLTLWNPFDELMKDEFWGRAPSAAARAHMPAVDVREDENSYVIEAELPGVKPDDVDINVDNRVLTLSAERSMESKSEQDGYHRVERRFGTFKRSFTLPDSVDVEHIDAELRDGVLHVTIPKRETARPRKIAVKGGSLIGKAKKALSGDAERAA